MSKKDGKLSIKVIEHMRLVDSIKGIDMENYKRLSKDSGVPVELIVTAVHGATFPNLSALEARIKESDRLGMSQYYIYGLKDAYKLLKPQEQS